ncbi:MAG: hypothetical protein ACRDI2_15590, partial [Chloroflexota bacterium]
GRPGGPPRRRGRPGQRDASERGDARGLPRSGEGWVLLREGEAPPPEPVLEDDQRTEDNETRDPETSTITASGEGAPPTPQTTP